jgi:hypothetical protein
MFVGGIIGGFWGERYHRRADATIADTRRSTVRTDHRTDDRVADDDRVAHDDRVANDDGDVPAPAAHDRTRDQHRA